jgi:mevalonate kinase
MVDAILEQHGRGKDISASIDSQIPGTRDWVLGRDPVATADSILDALGGVFTTGS